VAYQDLTGDKPDKSAPWDLLARQIFAIYDRARLAAFDKLVHDGMAAKAAGNHAEAVVAFDRILAEDPLFDDRKAMAPSYAAVASALPAEDGEQKLALYRKALRLDPDAPDAKKLESQIALTEAKLLIHDHRPDRFLLERAMELDPSNQEAKELLASFEEKAVEKKETSKKRYEGAAAIFAGMLAGVLAIGLWPRKK
jgi:tetratricopeptide (TPR) repeat protein